MCGIFFSESESGTHDRILELIKCRGKEFFDIKVTNNGCVFASAVLSIRGSVIQPVFGSDYVLQYNGEMYNKEFSDTSYINNLIKNIFTTGALKENGEDYDTLINNLYCEINKYDNEMAIIIKIKDRVYFFKDDIGRKSLGYSYHPFLISSCSYLNEIDPMSIYCYNLKEKKLTSRIKPQNGLIKYYICNLGKILNILKTPKYELRYEQLMNKYKNLVQNTPEFIPVQNNYSNDPIQELDQKLKESIKKRLLKGNIIIFFSGGVDSMLLAVYMHLISKIEFSIYLLNTSFAKSSDRSNGKLGYEELCKKFPERSFKFIEIDIMLDEIKENTKLIRSLIYPKNGLMDFNIGATLFFTAKEAKNYGRVVYLGSGADEIFGGYNRYKSGDFKDNMLFDIFTISAHNLSRDDRVISHNQIESRLPFLDRDIVKFALNLDKNLIIKKTEGVIENKCIIRELLRRHGFERAAAVPKKAMQYGTGISKLEQYIHK